jgi:hypothetical protein
VTISPTHGISKTDKPTITSTTSCASKATPKIITGPRIRLTIVLVPSLVRYCLAKSLRGTGPGAPSLGTKRIFSFVVLLFDICFRIPSHVPRVRVIDHHDDHHRDNHWHHNDVDAHGYQRPGTRFGSGKKVHVR